MHAAVVELQAVFKGIDLAYAVRFSFVCTDTASCLMGGPCCRLALVD